MAISFPWQRSLPRRDCRAALAMTARAKLGTREVARTVPEQGTPDGWFVGAFCAHLSTESPANTACRAGYNCRNRQLPGGTS